MFEVLAVQLEDAFQRRAFVIQKIKKIREVVRTLREPTLTELTKLRQDLWEAYHEHSKAHSCIVGHVPDEDLAQQEEEYDAFDKLFDEVSVPLEEKLIALRSANPSATENVAHQQQPWKMSVPTLFRNSSWATPTMTWGSVRPKLSGQTATRTARSKPETLDAEVDSRIHFPPTSSPSSTPETRSRFLTLDADTALRSRMPPTNGPCRQSKPAPASGALETEEVMRDHLPPTKPKPLIQLPAGDKFPPAKACRERITTISEAVDLPDRHVSANASEITSTKPKCVPLQAVQPGIDQANLDDGSCMIVPNSDDRMNNPDDSRNANDKCQPKVEIVDAMSLEMTSAKPERSPEDFDPQPEIEPMSTTEPKPKSDQQDCYRALPVGDTHTSKHEPLPAVIPANELDRMSASRAQVTTLLTIVYSDKSQGRPRSEPNPLLPTAAKAPDKNNRPYEHRNHNGSAPSGNQMKQRINVTATEECRCKVDVSRMNPNPENEPAQRELQCNPQSTRSSSIDLRQNDFFTGGLVLHVSTASEPHQHHGKKQFMQINTRSSGTRQPPNKRSRSKANGVPVVMHNYTPKKTQSKIQYGPVNRTSAHRRPAHNSRAILLGKISQDSENRVFTEVRTQSSNTQMLRCRQKEMSSTAVCHYLNAVTEVQPSSAPTTAVATHGNQGHQWISNPSPRCNKLDSMLRDRDQSRSMCTVPLQRKICIRSERVEGRSALKINVRTSEALGCSPNLNVTPQNLQLSRQSITAERRTTGCCVSEIPITYACIILVCSFFETTASAVTASKDSAGRGTSPPTNGRGQVEQSSVNLISISRGNQQVVRKFFVLLLCSIEDRPQEWIPEQPAHMVNPAHSHPKPRPPRRSNQHFNNGSTHTRDWPPRRLRDVGTRKPTNESEPAHRKCSVGKRKHTDTTRQLPNPMMTPSSTTATTFPEEAITKKRELVDDGTGSVPLRPSLC